MTRLAPDDFLVVVSDTAHGRALGLLRQAVGDAAVTVDDVTTDLGLLTVQGPASRDTLAAAAPEVDWSTEAFPFRSARRVTLAGVDVLAIRITYLGELGWELYSPADRTVGGVGCRARGGCGARHPAGRACARCRACGWRRATATTATTSTTPTTSTRSGSGSRWRSTSRVASPGGRRRWRPRSAGRRTTGSCRCCSRTPSRCCSTPSRCCATGWSSATCGRRRTAGPSAVRWAWPSSVATGRSRPQWLAEGSWEVDVAGTRHAARVSLRPMYDPTSARVTG